MRLDSAFTIPALIGSTGLLPFVCIAFEWRRFSNSRKAAGASAHLPPGLFFLSIAAAELIAFFAVFLLVVIFKIDGEGISDSVPIYWFGNTLMFTSGCACILTLFGAINRRQRFASTINLAFASLVFCFIGLNIASFH